MRTEWKIVPIPGTTHGLVEDYCECGEKLQVTRIRRIIGGNCCEDCNPQRVLSVGRPDDSPFPSGFRPVAIF